VDGVDPQAVRSILELELDSTSERHKNGSDVFESAGGYAPTMGIVGTVMGLVHVLGNLEDTSTLGPKIAVAFLATLYGIGSANLLWLPIANRLKQADEKEVKEKTLIIEGILYIQEGINPNTIAEKLKSFLNKEESLKYESIDGKAEL
jgi:chemotaxis protein MotA